VLEKIGERKDHFILQEWLAGEEYTCGTVTVGKKCYGAILMKRELRFGDTYKCHTVLEPAVSDYLVRLMDALQPFGACNVQMKLKGGEPCIFEINARCSGTTAARALCGFNEPLMVADYLLKGVIPSFKIEEKTILRYWKELEVENGLVASMKDKNSLSQPAHPRL
jgi:carbamoyl-phosphate synthase large subunit